MFYCVLGAAATDTQLVYAKALTAGESAGYTSDAVSGGADDSGTDDELTGLFKRLSLPRRMTVHYYLVIYSCIFT